MSGNVAACRGSNVNVIVTPAVTLPAPFFLPPSADGSPVPKRAQYPFAANTRYKTRSEILIMTEQWNTFERVENYDDLIYQQYEVGQRGETYYQFRSQQERAAYTAGQLLHVNTYTTLPVSAFTPIRDRPMPNVPLQSALPYFYNVPKNFNPTNVLTSSERAAQRADLEIYAFVSTYNQSHVIKWNFVKDEERLAYERGEQLALTPSSTNA
jgi:hypothetical protein